MLAEETTLTARYIYDPVSPGEPAQGDGQTNVDNNPEGDVTGDKTVDASDVVGLTNAFLSTSDNVKYDVNKDGTTDASDVVRIINIYLQK